MTKILEGKRVLVTGGTGSLGQSLVRRLLAGEVGLPEQITVLSRDEAKQHQMRLDYLHRSAATDEVIYQNSRDRLNFKIGDVRDFPKVALALNDIDIVVNAAALKQVPSCEYFPMEAVMTNVVGAANIVRAISELKLPVETVVGISTDKACKPINVMGMTKALQERIFIEGNLGNPSTRFVCVRYGNVIASRGSIVPLFVEQVKKGDKLTVTLPEMTRFLLSLDRAVDTVFAAITRGLRGETFVPKVPAARIVDLAKALMGKKELEISFTGIRPGEKLHEIMVSEEECFRTSDDGDHYIILPMLPELRDPSRVAGVLSAEYSSRNDNISIAEIAKLLQSSNAEIERFLAAGN